jgi:hypothetical protein
MNNPTPDAVMCDACGEMYPASISSPTAIDDGWWLPYETFGYYNGFTDNIEAIMKSDELLKSWSMCHACIVKLLDTFPLLAKSIERGAHPSPYSEKPCCNYAWSIAPSGGTVLASGGEWLVAPEKNDG